MTKLEQVARQALEALEWYVEEDDVMEAMPGNEPWVEGKRNAEKSIAALREALDQEQAEPSPTSGMNIAQRILHVGGRNNSAGYVEFGSIQAVQALVNQVIRDLPRPRRIPDHELVTMYDESPSSDADMIAFAHDVMDAMIYTAPQPTRQRLADGELDLILQKSPIKANYADLTALVRAVEKAHGIGGEA